MNTSIITRDLVRELFYHELSTGFLIRRKPCGNRKKGEIAGHVNQGGYACVKIFSKIYKQHRIIWLYYFGWLPEYLDHKNGVPSDNRLENLRPATRTQNNQNRRHKLEGLKGIATIGDKWRARIRVNGKYKHLGCFETPEEAHKAYCIAAIKYHGEFANLGHNLNLPVNPKLYPFIPDSSA